MLLKHKIDKMRQLKAIQNVAWEDKVTNKEILESGGISWFD